MIQNKTSNIPTAESPELLNFFLKDVIYFYNNYLTTWALEVFNFVYYSLHSDEFIYYSWLSNQQ